MPAPLMIGLTGGIGAGKSETLAAFARAGAATISSDAVVHELLKTEEVRDLLVERLGQEVAPDGRIARDKVAQRVFSKPDELAWLEGVLHPRVGQRLAAWRAEIPVAAELAVVEVPLLFETGMERFFDATACVIVDEDKRAERAAARGHEGVPARDDRQLSQEQKAARASGVIDNNGSLAELDSEVGGFIERALAGELDGRGGATG